MGTKADLRIARGELTRQKILAAAFEILIAEGSKSLTAGKLTAKAGVSKASLFHHFKKVDDVPFALLNDLIGQFQRVTFDRKPNSVAEFVKVIGLKLLGASQEHKKVTAAFVHFYTRSAHEKAFRESQEILVDTIWKQFEASLEQVLKRKLSRSERETGPVVLAFAMEGLALLSIVHSDLARLKKAWCAFSVVFEDLFSKGKMR